jgi:hypothetical protein
MKSISTVNLVVSATLNSSCKLLSFHNLGRTVYRTLSLRILLLRVSVVTVFVCVVTGTYLAKPLASTGRSFWLHYPGFQASCHNNNNNNNNNNRWHGRRCCIQSIIYPHWNCWHLHCKSCFSINGLYFELLHYSQFTTFPYYKFLLAIVVFCY